MMANELYAFQAFSSFIVLLIFLMIGLVLIPYVFFLLHLNKLLFKCKEQNRKMDPGLVYLNLIPLFNLGWLFYTVIKIRDTLKAEFSSNGKQSDDPEFGFSIGLAYCITSACSIIPIIGSGAALASLILWIVYWVKTYKYLKQLEN